MLLVISVFVVGWFVGWLVDCLLVVVGGWLFLAVVVGCWLLVVSCWLLIFQPRPFPVILRS